jgi:hypothetical protein
MSENIIDNLNKFTSKKGLIIRELPFNPTELIIDNETTELTHSPNMSRNFINGHKTSIIAKDKLGQVFEIELYDDTYMDRLTKKEEEISKEWTGDNK